MDKTVKTEADTVRTRKAEPLDLEFLSAVEANLTEWDSPSDDYAYCDL